MNIDTDKENVETEEVAVGSDEEMKGSPESGKLSPNRVPSDDSTEEANRSFKRLMVEPEEEELLDYECYDEEDL